MNQLIAIFLCALSVPCAALYIAARSIQERQTGRLGVNPGNGLFEWQWSAGRMGLGLLSVALGQRQLLGPQCGSSAAQVHRAGIFSPEQLQGAMGLERVANDAHFFASASRSERLALLLRSVIVQLFRSAPDQAAPAAARIFGVQFRNTTMPRAVSFIAAAARQGGRMRRVFFVNADCLNLAYSDRDYHFLLHDADLVLPDGSGVRLGLKWLGSAMHDNLNGTDLFPHLCAEAARSGLRIYLLGGQPDIARAAACEMQQRYPQLQIAGARDGFFTTAETASVIADINRSGADILLLGMGAPRQERWLSDHAAALQVGVGVGVGGLFDYYSGAVVRAPLWLRELGLEWVWRIVQQPGEKWRRYVLGNPLFLSRVLGQRYSLGRKSYAPLKTDGERTDWFSQTTPEPFSKARIYLNIWAWRLSLGLTAGLKRALDLTVASIMLLLLSPLVCAIACGIKLTSAGPVLYRQVRIGQRGRSFVMYKFRTMRCDADAQLAGLQSRNESTDGVLFKMARDPRVTPVGRWMRRFSIDELPQLFNVLEGSMSLVGPRPALPSELDTYQSVHLKRLQSKPGLTCWWQVSGRSDLPFSQQIELDMRYLSQQSIGEDLRLLARTIPAVVGGRGAY